MFLNTLNSDYDRRRAARDREVNTRPRWTQGAAAVFLAVVTDSAIPRDNGTAEVMQVLKPSVLQPRYIRHEPVVHLDEHIDGVGGPVLPPWMTPSPSTWSIPGPLVPPTGLDGARDAVETTAARIY